MCRNHTVSAHASLRRNLFPEPIFPESGIEKEQRTLAGLLTSLLIPRTYSWKNFVASLLFVLLLLVVGLPMLNIPFAFGGVGPAKCRL